MKLNSNVIWWVIISYIGLMITGPVLYELGFQTSVMAPIILIVLIGLILWLSWFIVALKVISFDASYYTMWKFKGFRIKPSWIVKHPIAAFKFYDRIYYKVKKE